MSIRPASGSNVLAGRPFPLGAHPEAGGVRFAVASTVAERVELCLIGDEGGERRIELTERTFGVWHGMVPGVTPGQRYGFRIHGPYDPATGMRCNPDKLLVDPYARRITGTVTDMASAQGYEGDHEGEVRSTLDSLGHVPLSVVTSPGGPDTGVKPDVPFEETVIYELHVKGFTEQHPDVPEQLRGTYLGLAHPDVVDHLVRLGVTAVELLPVHSFADEPSLVAAGRSNYWGYSPLGYFAPHEGYASEPGREVEEFRTMVAALHASNIEVIIDVVYNHTCEGGPDGPTLSFRGYEAPAYYLHDANGHMADITGCGNTVEAGSPTVVRMVTDSLRYWTTELGVDGFRFDLASTMGRPHGGLFDRDSALLTAIASDPVLSRCKLIAEPWDATGEGYKVGDFGAQWAEWNGIYRDTVRDFWRGAAGGVDDLAYRLSGSSDLYDHTLRRPWQSINFIDAHDGFTLRDLVSYDGKHNEANGEDNRDGTDDNRSWNHGVEGETEDADIRALRSRQARNMFATLMLSTGTPMFVAGDERWRTQGGNNNAYCLDDPTSWVDWTPSDDADSMLAFARRVIHLRAASPALRQPEFFDGRTTPSGRPDLIWLRPDGKEFDKADWQEDDRHFLGMWIDGSNSQSRTREGELLTDHSWLLLMHAGPDQVDVVLPGTEFGATFEPALDTTTRDGSPSTGEVLAAGSTLTLEGRSLLLLRAPRAE